MKGFVWHYNGEWYNDTDAIITVNITPPTQTTMKVMYMMVVNEHASPYNLTVVKMVHGTYFIDIVRDIPIKYDVGDFCNNVYIYPSNDYIYTHKKLHTKELILVGTDYLQFALTIPKDNDFHIICRAILSNYALPTVSGASANNKAKSETSKIVGIIR